MEIQNSKQHDVVIIGCGSIGERHTRCFLKTNRARVSICEPVEAVRQRIARDYAVTNSFETVGETLDGQSPGIAVVCTPADTHIQIARQLVDRGFHVLLEKPVSVSLEGVDPLLQAVHRTDSKCAVAYVLRNSPLLLKAKQMIDQQQLGPLRQVAVLSGQHFPTYRPAYRETYYRQRETGGGAIQDSLTHQVNLVQWFAGPMHSVAADCDRLVLEGVNVEDTVNVISRHRAEDGDGHSVMVSYSLNQHQAPNETVYRFVCHDGVVQVVAHEQRCEVQTKPDAGWTTVLETSQQRDDGFVAQANQFIDYVESDRRPSCSLEEGVHSLRANLAILEAAEQRRWVDVS